MSFTLAFMLLLAPGAQPPPRWQPSALELVWVDVHGSVSFAFEGVSAEVASLLDPAGVRTSWLVADPGTNIQIETSCSLRLLVVVLGSEVVAPQFARRLVMGSTLRREEPVDAVWAHLPAIAWTLGLAPRPSLWSPWDRREFTRALGRVVAHEIVHALAPELPHQRGGLMAARLGSRILKAHGVRLDPEVLSMVRAGFDRRAARAATEEVVAAALAE